MVGEVSNGGSPASIILHNVLCKMQAGWTDQIATNYGLGLQYIWRKMSIRFLFILPYLHFRFLVNLLNTPIHSSVIWLAIRLSALSYTLPIKSPCWLYLIGLWWNTSKHKKAWRGCMIESMYGVPSVCWDTNRVICRITRCQSGLEIINGRISNTRRGGKTITIPE